MLVVNYSVLAAINTAASAIIKAVCPVIGLAGETIIVPLQKVLFVLL